MRYMSKHNCTFSQAVAQTAGNTKTKTKTRTKQSGRSISGLGEIQSGVFNSNREDVISTLKHNQWPTNFIQEVDVLWKNLEAQNLKSDYTGGRMLYLLEMCALNPTSVFDIYEMVDYLNSPKSTPSTSLNPKTEQSRMLIVYEMQAYIKQYLNEMFI